MLNSNEVKTHLHTDLLIDKLHQAFGQSQIETPVRHHHNFKHPTDKKDSTLLLMPSWEVGQQVGVKLVTVTPENAKRGKPSINGLYLLFDASTGEPLCLMDASELTAKRTAAASALAAKFLCRNDASTLLVVGTGALSAKLVSAHSSVRNYEKILIWGRTPEKAEAVVSQYSNPGFELKTIGTLKEGIREADVVSVATLSPEPLIFGHQLVPGQHIDLIGSYLPQTREADSETLRRASVFVDTETALKESGDLAIPIKEGVLNPEDIQGSLYDLCNGSHQGRVSDDEITLFKSVGHASEDLVAARIVYESYLKK